jgi:hypothetical protein
MKPTDAGVDIINPVDAEALERAVALVLANKSDPGRVEQIEDMLRERDRVEVGQFCAYISQCAALGLRCWEEPPSSLDPKDIPTIIAAGPTDRDYAAAELAQRLLARGKSIFEPDLVAALADNR